MTKKIEEIIPAPHDQDLSGQEKSDKKWVFWYLIPSKGGQNIHWSEYLHPLHSFDSVSTFT